MTCPFDCRSYGYSGQCEHTNKDTRWRENLRDLHLTTTPDEEGYHIGMIAFGWGSFEFKPKSKEVCEFYLTTKDAMERFITSAIATAVTARENELVEKYGDFRDLQT